MELNALFPMIRPVGSVKTRDEVAGLWTDYSNFIKQKTINGKGPSDAEKQVFLRQKLREIIGRKVKTTRIKQPREIVAKLRTELYNLKPIHADLKTFSLIVIDQFNNPQRLAKTGSIAALQHSSVIAAFYQPNPMRSNIYQPKAVVSETPTVPPPSLSKEELAFRSEMSQLAKQLYKDPYGASTLNRFRVFTGSVNRDERIDKFKSFIDEQSQSKLGSSDKYEAIKKRKYEAIKKRFMNLVELPNRIDTVLGALIPHPEYRANVDANNVHIEAFLGGTTMNPPSQIKAEIPLVLAAIDEKIASAPTNNKKDQLTRLKFEFTRGVIYKTRGNWAEMLPLPGQFGLMRGMSTRLRVPVGYKMKPKVGDITFDNRKQLGKGSFGSVKTATGLFKELAAKKIALRRGNIDVDYHLFLSTAIECFYAQTLSKGSPNILGVHDMFVYDDGKASKAKSGPRQNHSVSKVVIVMDVAVGDGYSVMHDVNKTLGQKLQYAVDLANGLAFMHQQGVAHGDFKWANSVLGEDGIGKVADFGFVTPTKVLSSTLFDSEMVGGTYPSPEAMAVRKVRLHISDVDFSKIDVYAFGIALLQMADSAWRPVKTDADVDRLSQSQDLQQKRVGELIQLCCNEDPNSRPTMAIVVAKLQSVLSVALPVFETQKKNTVYLGSSSSCSHR